MPAKLGRRTMALTHQLFGIRSCNEVITGDRARPCLEYDIRRCIAPCVREICSPETYAVAVQDTRLFLEGRNDELVAHLRQRMADAAGAERFEQAAQLRDALRTIETVQRRQQKMAGTGLGDRDAFGLKVGPAGAVVQVFQVRGGKVVERVELEYDGRKREAGSRTPIRRKPEAGSRKPRSCRPRSSSSIPSIRRRRKSICRSRFATSESEVIEAWLTDRSEHRVRLVVPKRGEKRGLLDLAARNAQVAYQTRFNETVAAHYDALETLRAGARTCPSIPRRIECFDISTIQGSETVASMVVCEDGRMKRSEYRKFRDPRSEVRGPQVRTIGFSTISHQCRKSSGAATARCSSTAGRSRT